MAKTLGEFIGGNGCREVELGVADFPCAIKGLKVEGATTLDISLS